MEKLMRAMALRFENAHMRVVRAPEICHREQVFLREKRSRAGGSLVAATLVEETNTMFLHAAGAQSEDTYL